MIGLGIFTHSIGAPIQVGTAIDLQDIVRKACFNGMIQRQISVYGMVQKRLDFTATLRIDC